MNTSIAPSPFSNFFARHTSWVFAAMLFALFLSLIRPQGDLLAKAAFVVHVGLFIVWQPLVERGVEVSLSAAAGLFGLAGVLVFVLDGWVLSLWLVLLSAIVGGRVTLTGSRRERFGYLLGLTFLVLSLLTLSVPAAVPAATLPPIVRNFAELVLPLMLVVIALLPGQSAAQGRLEVVDFVNSVLILLLLAVLVLGSLAGMILFAANYAEALLKTLMMLGGALLLLGWLWNPHLGYSGLETFVSRYLMSIGISAEQWLEALADLAVHESDPEHFLAEACSDLQRRLPWVRGIGWTAGDARATVGDQNGHSATFNHQGVTLTITTRYPLPPSLAWHINLLVQFLAEFHADKQRQVRLKELSYLQAVHETGARLTHDVKNLLQSLQTLVFAAENAGLSEPEEFRALMQRQLPVIVSRLATTLKNLRTPGQAHDDEIGPASTWWADARRRYTHLSWVRFEPLEMQVRGQLPGSVASAVLDNVLGNAEHKRMSAPDLQVKVSLDYVDDSRWAMRIEDDGAAIPDAVARQLFARPVKSHAGLGIGLYQAARLAGKHNCALRLASNVTGRVIFEVHTDTVADQTG